MDIDHDEKAPTISLAEFVRQGWHVVEPCTDLAWNWHVDAICRHLEAVTRRDLRRLVINVPPGHMKSLLVGVFWPAWEWTFRPGERTIFGSYSLDLAVRDSVRCRHLLNSEWYRDAFRPEWKIERDQNAKDRFVNDRKGERMCVSVSGQGTGYRASKVVVDDPLNAADQFSELAREECIRWWDQVLSTRLNDPRTGARVIIMQRLHEKDLSGHVLAKGGYEHLCLPSEFEPDRACRTSLPWSDPRAAEGELLFPERFPAEVLLEARRDLGAAGYASQHQQRPSPAGGEIFRKAWFRYWSPELKGELYRLHADVPRIARRAACRRFGIMDLAFSSRTSADYTVIQAWAITPNHDLVLLDSLRERLSGPQFVPALRRLMDRHDLEYFGVEDVQAQRALIQIARGQGLTVRGLRPDKDKVARAQPAAIRLESEQVFFPRDAPWLDELEHELLIFPHGAHDDQVDGVSYAIGEGERRGAPHDEDEEHKIEPVRPDEVRWMDVARFFCSMACGIDGVAHD